MAAIYSYTLLTGDTVQLRPQSRLMRLVLPSYGWITEYPYIYTPKDITPENISEYITTLYHENVHLKQQILHDKYIWYFKYATIPSFRLQMEAEAIATELFYTPKNDQENVLESYTKALSSWNYWFATLDPDHAESEIMKEYKKLTSVPLG